MSVDPQVIRAEAHCEIDELLQQNVDVLLERWSARAVEEQPNAKRVHHAILLDHLRDFLQSLGRSLGESRESYTNQHCLPAVTHGEERWESGWSLSEVIRDYQILRLVILDFLEEALDRPLDHREGLAIGLALDEAIAASVVMYVKSRDEYARQIEERRANEDRQIQERLREQSAALQAADQRKNEFLAMLAHELRNPLAPIRNAVEFIELKSQTDSELQWACDVIDRQVGQMKRMVDDLLDVSRITRGKLRLEREIVNVATVAERAIEMARPLIDARKHQLTILMPPQPLWVEADPARLAQVLANLLTNSAKYTDERGKIWLTAEAEGKEVTIKVRDTGIGIPPEILVQVFEPFIQEERSLDRAHGGLGVGLALVRSLVELHGGRVRLFSEGRGKGTEAVVYLPAVKSRSGPADPPSKPARGGKPPSRRILVVDDNVDSANSLAILLRVLGHDVRTAHDGVSALEMAAANPPEITLLDIGLPRIDGLEVARRLRHEIGLKKLLLIAMTGYGQDDDRHRSQEAGFNAHLVKPIDIKALQELLARPEALQAGETAAEA